MGVWDDLVAESQAAPPAAAAPPYRGFFDLIRGRPETTLPPPLDPLQGAPERTLTEISPLTGGKIRSTIGLTLENRRRMAMDYLRHAEESGALEQDLTPEASLRHQELIYSGAPPQDDDHSIWGWLRWLDSPRNALMGGITEAFNGDATGPDDPGFFRGLWLGLSNQQHYTGLRAINSIYSFADPEGFRSWRRRAMLAEIAPEMLARRSTMGPSDGDVVSTLSPMGDWAPFFAGHAVDIFLDPLGRVIGKLGKISSARAAALREGRVVEGNLSRGHAFASGLAREMEEGHLIFPPEVAAVRKEVIEPYISRMYQKLGRSADKYLGVSLQQVLMEEAARPGLSVFMPGGAKAETAARGIRESRKEFTEALVEEVISGKPPSRGTRGVKGARARTLERVAEVEGLQEGERRFAALWRRYDEAERTKRGLGKLIDTDMEFEAKLGAIVEQPAVLNEIAADATRGLDKFQNLGKTARGPLTEALTGADPARRVRLKSEVTKLGADVAERLEGQVAVTGRGMVAPPDQRSLEALMAVRYLERPMEEMMSAIGKGALTPEDQIEAFQRYLKETGVSEKVAELSGPATRDAFEAAMNVGYILREGAPAISKSMFKAHPDMFARQTGDNLAREIVAENTIRALDRLAEGASKGAKIEIAGAVRTPKEIRDLAKGLREIRSEWSATANREWHSAYETAFGGRKVLGSEPFGAFFRDVERVFRGTGAFQILQSGQRATRAIQNHYATRWAEEVSKDMARGDRLKLFAALDIRNIPRNEAGAALDKAGKVMSREQELAAAREALEQSDAALVPRYDRARAIFNDWADIMELPQEHRISGYFPHMMRRDSDFAKNLKDGWLPPEVYKDRESLAVINRSLDTEYVPGALRKRTGALDEVLTDVDTVAGFYFSQMAKTRHMNPAMEQARAILKDLVDSGARKPAVLDYLDDLKAHAYGKPTRLEDRMLAHVSNLSERFGMGPVQFSNATRLSMALNAQVYRSTIAASLPFVITNLTQNILTGAENGMLATLRGMASIVQRHDPMEVALAADRAKPLSKAMAKSLTSDWNDLFNPNGWLTDARGRVDKWLFAGGEATEYWNRGTAFHVGASEALRSGKNIFDAIRHGQMVADETQFVYGLLGRAPVFNNFGFRPLISPFTSYPSKMVALMGRQLRENPTALARYIGITGWVSNILSRFNVDPGQIAPFSFVPEPRYGNSMLPPVAKLAVTLLRMGPAGIAKLGGEGEDLDRETKQLGRDLVYNLSLLAGVPQMLPRQAWSLKNILYEHEIRPMGDFNRALWQAVGFEPYAGELPRMYAYEPESSRRYAAAVARILGFGTYSEKIAREVSDLARKYERQGEQIRSEAKSIARKSRPEWTDEDRAHIQEYISLYGFDSYDKLEENLWRTYQTVSERAATGWDAATARRMESTIAEVRGRDPAAAEVLRLKERMDRMPLGVEE